ncbi:hypothetical protein [Modestobacter roseus]|uniref:Uncharacterized protein n=1 Tax=Modestobacter roseus TaxID=1181884 RepID=A0A562ILJ5_9ACTN|nr:hypothetical protein [Modestobacter roseus]MQA34284.1 hypothetical protein [Modestobacter roseus]TWH71879.1 hypothetical protein JD78_00379 [Modestobacter roseus]
MMVLACNAVGQAALAAGVASLDDALPEQLLYVAGWMSTATDLTQQSMLIADLGSTFDVLI